MSIEAGTTSRPPQKERPLPPHVIPNSPQHPEGPQQRKSSGCCHTKSGYQQHPRLVRAIDILLIAKFAVDGDFVISWGVLDLTESNRSGTSIQTKNKEVYRPDAGGLELFEKLRLAWNRGFLLICQLLRNFPRHDTVSWKEKSPGTQRVREINNAGIHGVSTHWCPRQSAAQTPRKEHASLAQQR